MPGRLDWEREEDGAQGRNRTADTVIFSHVLYQLSYLGPQSKLEGLAGSASLTVVVASVHPAKIGLVRRRPGNAIAVAQPFQEVAILAALAAERRMIGGGGPAAERAALGA